MNIGFKNTRFDATHLLLIEQFDGAVLPIYHFLSLILRIDTGMWVPKSYQKSVIFTTTQAK